MTVGQRDINGSSRPRQNSSAVAAASKHRRQDDDAQIDVVLESGNAARQQPHDGCEHDDQRNHVAAVEIACACPGQAVGQQHQGIGDVDRHEVGDGAARGRECKTGGVDDLRGAPPHRRADGAVLQPGEDQERTQQRRDEDRYDRKGANVEIHGVPPPANFAAI
jgi:hypothetical protein